MNRTCGTGVAAQAGLPAKLSQLLAAMAENLRLHQATLDGTDEDARTELALYVALADEQVAVAAKLRITAERMARAHDLPMGRHDAEALADPRVADAFARFVQVERELLALLEKAVERDEAILAESDEVDPLTVLLREIVAQEAVGHDRSAETGDVERLAALLQPIPPVEALPRLVAAVRAVIPADALAVWRLDASRGGSRIVAAEGLTDTYVRGANEPAVGGALPEITLPIDDVLLSPLLEDRRDAFTREGIRSLLALPLRLDGESRATLTFYWRAPQQLGAERVAAGASLAAVLAGAMDRTGLLSK